MAVVAIPTGDPCHEGRLAGATQRQVADAYYRNGRSMACEPIVGVSKIAPGNQTAIG